MPVFVCDPFDQGGGEISMLLRVDSSIDCESTEYTYWRLYAVLMLFVYPIGIPTYMGALLFRNRNTLNHLAREPEKDEFTEEELEDNELRRKGLKPSVQRVISGYKVPDLVTSSTPTPTTTLPASLVPLPSIPSLISRRPHAPRSHSATGSSCSRSRVS